VTSFVDQFEAARTLQRSSAADFEVVITAKELVAEGVQRLTFEDPAGGPLPPWTPGAHVDLVLRPDLIRQYSLCGDPADGSSLQVAVLREPQGRGGSAHVHDQLSPGDRVLLRGPRNHFPLVTSPRYLFIAGGIGITPIVPMVGAVEAAGADWHLLYGGRTRASMAFCEELTSSYGSSRISIRPQDQTGLLDLERHLGAVGDDTAVYCCGPAPLLDAVQARCQDWPTRRLHLERFSPNAEDAITASTSFEVELARSGVTLVVPSDASILETVEAAGIDVLNSCREGTCGACETPVLGGVIDHRDSLLSEEEKAAQDTMLVCVSRACGPKLVLDL
jgi:ferredoxin-NADP reductase